MRRMAVARGNGLAIRGAIFTLAQGEVVHYSRWFGLLFLSLSACSGDADPIVQSSTEQLAAASASGVVPSGLPARVVVGLFEDSGGTWMKSSGARWDVRYRYFVKGWVN